LQLPLLHRSRNRLFIDVELAAERLDQIGDALLGQVHHEVDVVGLAGNAVDRAGVRPAQVIGDP
jgi:hypothetical protein